MHKNLFVLSILTIFSLVLVGYTLSYGVFVLEKSQEIPTVQEKVPTKKIVSYIINLDRSKDRYEYVKKSVQELGFDVERVPAIDGQNLSDCEIDECVDFKSYSDFLGHLPKKGTIGCSLSHIKTWEKFLDSSFEYALIFEDDVHFDPHLLKSCVQALILERSLWDIVNFEPYHNGTPLLIKKLSGTSGESLVVYLTNITHAGAYLIHRDTAKKLLEKAFPIKMPIDHYFTRSWELGIKFVGIEPRIVSQSFGDSEIGSTKVHEVKQLEGTKQKHSLKKLLYKTNSSLIKFLYNLKLYIQLKSS